MDMFNKLKAKLAEEMDSETETVGGVTAGNGTQNGQAAAAAGIANGKSAEALTQEVQDLKEHINKNYYIYIRRLEKRKERIKELEEYAKLVLKDNETLTDQMKNYKECQTQLSECRENLEQLEGFQNQELSKVKHMLLSRETALDKETKERVRLQEELKAMASKAGSEEEDKIRQLKAENEKLKSEIDSLKQTHESEIHELSESHEAKLLRLEERISNQDLSGDERLDAVVKERDSLEAELKVTKDEVSKAKTSLSDAKAVFNQDISEAKQSIADLESKVSALTSERDSAKNSLLELEIAHHENEATAGSEKEKVKMDLAKIVTEKETLEMTLELRDKELKAKKEEFRKELANLSASKADSEKETQMKSVRISSLEAELLHLKNKLSEESSNLLVATSNNDKLESSVQFLEETLQIKEKYVATVQKNMDEEKEKLSKMKEEFSEMKEKFDRMNSEYDDLVLKISDLTQERDQLREQKEELMKRSQGLETESKELKAVILEKETSFDSRVEKTERVQKMKKQIQEMEDELADKRKIIRLHNQRMNDMKKTFQREMKPGTSASDFNAGGTSNGLNSGSSSSPPSSSPSPSPATGGASAFNPGAYGGLGADLPMTTSQDLILMTEVNYKYLKHVIFKFFTSRDYEAKNLTKAISVLLRFTQDEERLFQEHLDWKLSWFGARPKLGSGQFSLSIDPS